MIPIFIAIVTSMIFLMMWYLGGFPKSFLCMFLGSLGSIFFLYASSAALGIDWTQVEVFSLIHIGSIYFGVIIYFALIQHNKELRKPKNKGARRR